MDRLQDLDNLIRRAPDVESFNGRFRDECLNEHWFLSMAHAREVIERWRVE